MGLKISDIHIIISIFGMANSINTNLRLNPPPTQQKLKPNLCLKYILMYQLYKQWFELNSYLRKTVFIFSVVYSKYQM